MKIKKIVMLASMLLLASCTNIKLSSDSSISDNLKESTTISDISSTSSLKSSDDVSSSINSNKLSLNKFTYSSLNEINNDEGLTPSTGDVNILLIPLHFSDSRQKMDTNLINIAFNSKQDELVEWYSVHEFYQISSYNKLNLNFVMSEVYTPSHSASYYTNNYNNYNYVYASDSILKEALTYLQNKMDLTQFDSNNDGYIDGVYFIYDYPVDFSYQNELWWAYTYYYQEEDLFSSLKAKSYVFAGYDFFTSDGLNCDTHTYIHEMAHMFGIDDYYDYDTSKGTNRGGLAGGDLMDSTIGDHNAYSKALLQWNEGVYVSGEGSVEVELENFEKSGNFIILANSFNKDLGLFQEYFILEYYTPTYLHEFDQIFNVCGIRVLHIVATKKKDGTLRYNNTDTNYKLISQITNENGSTYISNTAKRSDDTLFVENESLKNVKLSDESTLKYGFKVNSLNDDKAFLTIYSK